MDFMTPVSHDIYLITATYRVLYFLLLLHLILYHSPNSVSLVDFMDFMDFMDFVDLLSHGFHGFYGFCGFT